MTNRVVAALVAATVATTLAAIAAAAGWPTRALIMCGWTSLTGWVLFAALSSYDQLADRIEESTRRIERAGDDRHADGIVEGMRRGSRPSPTLRRVR